MRKYKIITELVSTDRSITCTNTYLQYSILNWGWFETPEILEFISKASEKDVTDANSHGQTALHCAALRRLNLSRSNDCFPHPECSEEWISRVEEEMVQALLDKGADINAKDSNGETPLHCTALGRNENLFIFLVKKGANLEALNGNGKTVLQLAIKAGFLSAVDLFLAKTFKIKDSKSNIPLDCMNLSRKIENPFLSSVLYENLENAEHETDQSQPQGVDESCNSSGFCLSPDKPQVLVNDFVESTSVNYTVAKLWIKTMLKTSGYSVLDTKDQLTDLHIAILKNFLPGINLLFSRNLDVNVTTRDGLTCLHFAVLKNYKSLVKKLLRKGADINSQDRDGQTPLHFAIKERNEMMCQLLLENGADANTQDKEGQTPLHLATEENSEVICSLLLTNGAYVNSKDHKSQTSLHIAARKNSEPVCKLLLTRNAKVNAIDNKKQTPLHLAINEPHGDIVSLLLEMGADVNLKNDEGNSSFHIAILKTSKDVIKQLLDKKANLEEENGNGEMPLIMAMNDYINELKFGILVDSCVSVNIANKEGTTPLHYSAMIGSKELVAKVLTKGAYLEAKDIDSRTALHCAILFCNLPIVKLLLEKGADIIAKDNQGRTPLQMASEYSYRSGIVEALLDWGCSMKEMNASCFKFNLHNLKRYVIKLTLVKLQADLVFEDLNGFNSYKSTCIEEVERLKSSRLGRHSLYDVFCQYNDPMFLSNIKLEEAMTSPVLESDFPTYASLLKATFIKAKTRFVLLDKAQNVMLFPLPNEIVRKILSYVKNEDLQNIIKVR